MTTPGTLRPATAHGARQERSAETAIAAAARTARRVKPAPGMIAIIRRRHVAARGHLRENTRHWGSLPCEYA